MTTKEQALAALAILETDFCMGADNRAINDEGVFELLETIRVALQQLEAVPSDKKYYSACGKFYTYNNEPDAPYYPVQSDDVRETHKEGE